MAHAHSIENGSGFLAGISHPVLGFDHLLAMVSVGILSTQMGGKAIWTVPLTFIGVMVLGGWWGMQGTGLAPVELGISFSVFALGLALAIEKKLPQGFTLLFVGIFALFHGYAHGLEMPGIAQPALYTAGFITGTAGIHIIGILLGIIFMGIRNGDRILRYGGAGIAGIGVHLLIQ